MTDRPKRKRSFWGWGYEDRFPDKTTQIGLGQFVATLLGMNADVFTPGTPMRIEDIELPKPRVSPPTALAAIAVTSPEERILRTYGRNYRDILRGFRGDYRAAPDLVLRPTNETEIVRALDWASHANVAVVPFGGGTNVVGATECDPARDGHGNYRGVAILDLGALDRVLDIDKTSLSARIQAGATGPSLEAELAAKGLTLRHFPQSFEFSTLGGWIATRAGGHFATLYTHIDDLVQSIRMITPSGPIETPRLPASGAGPNPDRLILGSEGTLGVITEAWMRVRPRPVFRSTASVFFDDYERAVSAVRSLAQSGLYPTNCRLLDAREATLFFVPSDGAHALMLGFESADHPLESWMRRALDITEDYGGRCPDGALHSHDGSQTGNKGAAGSWKQAFTETPYLFNSMVALGVVADTFETAITWDRFEALHAEVIREVHATMRRECGAGYVSCRFSHVYPDGPAPYFTFLAPGRRGAELEQWAAIRNTASDIIARHGATITHHHAVGRIHKPWYEKERPPLFATAIAAARRALDPSGILNPGALW